MFVYNQYVFLSVYDSGEQQEKKTKLMPLHLRVVVKHYMNIILCHSCITWINNHIKSINKQIQKCVNRIFYFTFYFLTLILILSLHLHLFENGSWVARLELWNRLSLWTRIHGPKTIFFIILSDLLLHLPKTHKYLPDKNSWTWKSSYYFFVEFL